MSDVMKIMPFENLMQWIQKEKENMGSIFGVKKIYKACEKKYFNIYKEHIETPIGPAAGPNSQLTQNIVASFVAGARFFELKTVQELNGEALAKCVNKPCIKAEDECYNCEWSTELYMDEAIQEYIKAWVILHFIAKEYGLGATDGFVFNMSVGYNLLDIKKKDTDTFIECMKDANKHPIFKKCKDYLYEHISEFKNFKKEDIDNIKSEICTSVTESTLHGCPPDEIERIAKYLMEEKGLNTFIKCNPTLLGYDTAREILDEMGFNYVSFTDSHFKGDLQYADAITMLKRLKELANKLNLTFGVKLTNTFPVDVTRNELPSNEMYMSGKSLFPLSLTVAKKLATDFNGNLKISYSGGADNFNIKELIDCGIWPVTVATTILKPGGYDRFSQMAENIMSDVNSVVDFKNIDVNKLNNLLEKSKKDKHLIKKKRFVVNKINSKSPLIDCYVAPCSNTCPINQDISLYNFYVNKKEYDKAFEVILRTNPLPFMTGNICPHPCETSCMRNHYEDPVDIRGNKLLATRNAYDNFIKSIKPVEKINKNVAIVGAGPAGIALSTFLSREGVNVTVYDENSVEGGVVANIIPSFRISADEIKKDVDIAKSYAVKFVMNTKIDDIEKLKSENDVVVLAIGAHKEVPLLLEKGDSINAHRFLREFKETNGNVNIGETVAVIGAGNTAMDSARAAIKNINVKKVYLVYRRTIDEMPADLEELEEAIKDGVEFMPLLAPKSFENGELICNVVKLGDVGSDGRRSVVETNEIKTIKVDTIIASIGEKVDGEFYKKFGIKVTDKGLPELSKTNETSIKNVYAIGDGGKGASIIVKAIRDAKIVATDILNKEFSKNEKPKLTDTEVYKNRAILRDIIKDSDASRCLNCNYICETCNEVCPNRANVNVILAGGRHEVVHIDAMCNECGNCEVFCPYASKPYKEKWTLFTDESAMNNSTNNGFYYKDDKTAVVRIFGNVFDYTLGTKNEKIGDLAEVIDKIKNEYSYFIF